MVNANSSVESGKKFSINIDGYNCAFLPSLKSVAKLLGEGKSDVKLFREIESYYSVDADISNSSIKNVFNGKGVGKKTHTAIVTMGEYIGVSVPYSTLRKIKKNVATERTSNGLLWMSCIEGYRVGFRGKAGNNDLVLELLFSFLETRISEEKRFIEKLKQNVCTENYGAHQHSNFVIEVLRRNTLLTKTDLDEMSGYHKLSAKNDDELYFYRTREVDIMKISLDFYMNALACYEVAIDNLKGSSSAQRDSVEGFVGTALNNSYKGANPKTLTCFEAMLDTIRLMFSTDTKKLTNKDMGAYIPSIHDRINSGSNNENYGPNDRYRGWCKDLNKRPSNDSLRKFVDRLLEDLEQQSYGHMIFEWCKISLAADRLLKKNKEKNLEAEHKAMIKRYPKYYAHWKKQAEVFSACTDSSSA